MTKEEKIEKASAAYRDGKSIKEVSDLVETPAMTIYRWMKSAGVVMKAPGEWHKGREWTHARRAHHPKKPHRDPTAPMGYDILTERAFGSKHLQKRGYVTVTLGKKRKQYEHILIAEKAIGRRLQRGEVVHHINCIRNDNRPENLLVCSISYHLKLHAAMRSTPYWRGVEAHAKSINYRNL